MTKKNNEQFKNGVSERNCRHLRLAVAVAALGMSIGISPGDVLAGSNQPVLDAKSPVPVQRPAGVFPKVERPAAEFPKVERPAAQFPKVERPAAEFPKVERPGAQFPKVDAGSR